MVVIALMAFGGCTGGDYATAPVEGTVTFEGRPVSWGAVLFTPQQSAERATGPGRTAAGAVDDQGRFRLSTYGEYDGAIVGTHSVQFRYDPKEKDVIEKINAFAQARGKALPGMLRPKSTSTEIRPGSNMVEIELIVN
jgi:hypothetical protein